MFNLDLQRFGSTTVTNSTPVNGATQLTETGKEIEGINRDYLRVLSPVLQNLANTGGAQVGTSLLPDYNSMYGQGLNQLNQANVGLNNLNSQVASNYAGLNNQYANVNSNYANQMAGAGNEYNLLNGQLANMGNSAANNYSVLNGQIAGMGNQANSEYATLNNKYSELVNGELSNTQKAVMQNAVNNAITPYNNSFNNLANNGIINSSVGKQWASDANTAANTAALNSYSDIMNTANNAYQSQQAGINSKYNTLGNAYSQQMSGLGNMYSTLGNSLNSQLSGVNNKYSTLGNNYTSALSGLGQQASNYNQGVGTQSSLLNSLMGSAANPYNYAAGFQSAASSNAKDLLSLATGSYSPVGSTFSDYLKAGTGQTSSSTSTDNSGFGSILGSGLGYLAATCFAKNTKISTPKGDVPIECINNGDTVKTLIGDAVVKKTITTSDMPVVELRTDKGNVTCTESEVFLTVNGPMQVVDMAEGDIIIHKDGAAIVESIVDAGRETVYEIVVPWFYANGLCVDGFDPEGV